MWRRLPGRRGNGLQSFPDIGQFQPKALDRRTVWTPKVRPRPSLPARGMMTITQWDRRSFLCRLSLDPRPDRPQKTMVCPTVVSDPRRRMPRIRCAMLRARGPGATLLARCRPVPAESPPQVLRPRRDRHPPTPRRPGRGGRCRRFFCPGRSTNLGRLRFRSTPASSP